MIHLMSSKNRSHMFFNICNKKHHHKSKNLFFIHRKFSVSQKSLSLRSSITSRYTLANITSSAKTTTKAKSAQKTRIPFIPKLLLLDLPFNSVTSIKLHKNSTLRFTTVTHQASGSITCPTILSTRLFHRNTLLTNYFMSQLTRNQIFKKAHLTNTI